MIFPSKVRFFTESPRKGKTMKRLISTISVALVVTGTSLGFATTALASTTCSTDSNGTVTCTTDGPVSYGAATDQSSSSAYALSRTDTGAVILVYTHFSFNETKAKAQHRCFWVKKAYNGGYWAGHSGFYWQLDHNLHVCKSNASPTGYIKIGGGITGADCHNPIRLIKSPPPVKRIVTGTVKWQSHFTYKATAKVTSTSTAQVSVSVSTHNSDNSCQASASASASGKGTGTGSATATASTAFKAKSAAVSSATITAHVNMKASAYARAYSSAQATASAEAFCSPPQQTQQTPPSIVSMTQLNDVDAGATSPNWCSTVNVPGSDPGTLTFSAQYGSFTTSTFTVNGEQQECSTYVAPTEVPSGGNDTITVFVRDNTTGLSAQQSETFPINSPPPPPA